jgi:hypothetical protein
MELTATPWEESSGTCDCCGNISKTIWGVISTPHGTVATYYVQWTVGSAEHFPNIDLIIGRWGDGADPTQRVLVSLKYRPDRGGGSFMVIDSDVRPANNAKLCGRALKRVEVVETPLAEEVFQLVDTIWLQDPRIAGLRDLDNQG